MLENTSCTVHITYSGRTDKTVHACNERADPFFFFCFLNRTHIFVQQSNDYMDFTRSFEFSSIHNVQLSPTFLLS